MPTDRRPDETARSAQEALYPARSRALFELTLHGLRHPKSPCPGPGLPPARSQASAGCRHAEDIAVAEARPAGAVAGRKRPRCRRHLGVRRGGVVLTPVDAACHAGGQAPDGSPELLHRTTDIACARVIPGRVDLRVRCGGVVVVAQKLSHLVVLS